MGRFKENFKKHYKILARKTNTLFRGGFIIANRYFGVLQFGGVYNYCVDISLVI